MQTVLEIDGEKVRAARKRAFLSMGELAKQAEVGRDTVSRIENRGISEVHPRTIRKIAASLDVDPASLTPEE
jgi:predicted transcriptional regulator